MASKAIIGAFLILIILSYIMVINSLNFDMAYKVLLYIPALLLFLVFMYMGFGNKSPTEEVGGFPY
jgi:hypothetical protein